MNLIKNNMINLNKYNLKAGDTVVLDKDFNNSSIVTIVSISTIYALIKDEEGNEWEVMVNRLTPFEEFELLPCEKCLQLTNHLNDVCQKCKGQEIVEKFKEIISFKDDVEKLEFQVDKLLLDVKDALKGKN